jgi:hypothetical protein
MQAGLELAAAVAVVAGRNGTNFSQCSIMCGGFPWARGSGFWLMLPGALILNSIMMIKSWHS